MSRCRLKLNAKSVRAVEGIAEGRSYEEIVELHPDLTCYDVFNAAREVLSLLGEERADYGARLARIRQRYPRAYYSWTAEDDGYLRQALDRGDAVAAIAAALEKPPSAARHRMAKLGLSGNCTSAGGVQTPRCAR